MSASADQGKSICRDYARGVCSRGNKCKFYHLPEGQIPEEKLPICKDFQNKGCDRAKCKFFHISKSEEEEYNITGQLPSHGGRPKAVGGGGMGNYTSQIPQDICKDFLNNICQRGSLCKFRHVAEDMIPGGPGPGMYGKRRRDDFGGVNMAAMSEENEMLRRKITDLQRQVVDLRQMNDTLYDQNTRYRNQIRSNGTPAIDPYGTAAASGRVATAYPPVVTNTSVAPTVDNTMMGYEMYPKLKVDHL